MSVNSNNKTAINPLVVLNSGKFKWRSHFTLFQKFVQDPLNIEGKWSVPRTGCKQLKTNDITIQWYQNQSVLLEGPLTEKYRKILERIATISPDSESKLGVGSVEDLTPPHMPSLENINKFMLNFSSPCFDSSNLSTGELSESEEFYEDSTSDFFDNVTIDQVVQGCKETLLCPEETSLNDVVKCLDSLTQQLEKH
jgi:hypothetical protein